MQKTMQHPMEHNVSEQTYFEGTLTRSGYGARAAYRRAVEVLTGGLPTWANRKPAGRKPKAH